MEYLTNPVSSIPVDFPGFVNQRKAIESRRMDGNNVPNYAYAVDYELRKKLDAIPGLSKVAKKYCGTYTSEMIQNMNRNALRVGPNQFPEVYEMGRHCADKLGIGVPNIFILGTTEINAVTYAYDDIEPVVVLYSGLYERLTEGELLAIIGHECGHIHNQHGSYKMLVQILLNGGMNGAAMSLSQQIMLLLNQAAVVALNCWNRAAEVTADRGAMICCNDLADCYSSMAKFMYGGAFGEHTVDYAAIDEQLKMTVSNIAKYEELLNEYSTHPATARRIAAMREFSACEKLYEWRPDFKKPGIQLNSKAVTDDECRKFINITKEG